MARTFSSSAYTTTQSLTNPATDNPATVTSTGVIDVNSTSAYSAGISGASGFAWTITNLGTVESVGNKGIGIILGSGGLVTNGASGSTAAYVNATLVAIQIQGTTSGLTGTVVNFGSIRAVSTNSYSTGINFNSAVVGTVTNYGTIIEGAVGTSGGGDGIQLVGGGTVVNSGLINAAYGLNEVGVGDFSAGTAVTVVNTGTILAAGTTSGVGVNINSGSVNNSGLISGNSTGVNIGPGVGTVVNSGTISATKIGVTGTPFVTGVVLAGGGTVINGTAGSSAGLITAYDVGISSFGTGGAATVINYGTIQSTQTGTAAGSGFVGFGLQIGRAATISNFGTISAAQTNGGGAINLSAGGSITNGASSSTTALITSPFQGINISGSAGTIANFGTVSQTGTAGFNAINLGADGTISNLGTISAAGTFGTGVNLNGGGTISNTGTIAATGLSGNAINFGTAGGEIINGSSISTAGLVSGYNVGINFFPGTIGTPGTVTIVNYGQIRSTETATNVINGFTHVGVRGWHSRDGRNSGPTADRRGTQFGGKPSTHIGRNE